MMKRARVQRRQRIRACRFDETQPTQQAYERARDLPRLLPLLPGEMTIATVQEHLRLLALLRRALRLERNRGKSGHWTYDLARHSALLRAYRSERSSLKARFGGRGMAPGMAARRPG